VNLSRDEKINIISENGYSGDVSNARNIAHFLHDDDKEVVGQTCFFLGYLGARSCIAEIRKYLDDEDSNLINMCLCGLALMVDENDGYLSDTVLPFVEHESILVRMSAVEVLGRIKNNDAQRILMKRFDDEDLAVKFEIIKALGRIGEESALPLLKSYLTQVESMDQTIPRSAGSRGSNPHPEALQIVVQEAIAAIEK